MDLPTRDIGQYIAKRANIVVKAAIMAANDQGELLLIQHAEQGHWRIPVGEMRPGETIEGAALRELWEETGWITESMSFESLYSGPELRQVHANGDEEYYVIALFKARIILDHLVEARVNSDAGLKFFEPNALPPMNSISQTLLEQSGLK
ncbi:NUDIX domain-containing protein [Paenibacillus polysaccharolyticus]|uniref:NUDIX domain-containing protein n=1 Tax=Paenibacillus polysaccharolyticus TaxID=582692 RepID=UPI00280AB37D|nr:NUDIX domain-containing protein [Paenibacillus polysaccharolyticus]